MISMAMDVPFGSPEIQFFAVDNSRHLQVTLKESACPICCFDFAIGDTVLIMPCCNKPVDPICFRQWMDESYPVGREDLCLVSCVYCRSTMDASELNEYYGSKIPGISANWSAYWKGGEHHLEGLREIFTALCQAQESRPTPDEILDKARSIDWPLVRPDRLQSLHKHFLGLYRNPSATLDEPLLERRSYESWLPDSSNLINLSEKSIGRFEGTVSDMVVFRVEQTSLTEDKQTDQSTLIRGFRSHLFVCAHPKQTFQELTMEWIKLRFGSALRRCQRTNQPVEYFVTQLELSDSFPLFFVQRGEDFVRVPPHVTIEGAGLTNGDQIYLAEEVDHKLRMNIEWQRIWNELLDIIEFDLLERRARQNLRDKIIPLFEEKLSLYMINKEGFDRLKAKPGMEIAVHSFRDKCSGLIQCLLELKREVEDLGFSVLADMWAKIITSSDVDASSLQAGTTW